MNYKKQHMAKKLFKVWARLTILFKLQEKVYDFSNFDKKE